MTRKQMIGKLAWQRNGMLPWHARMLLWSELRGHPFGHGQTCNFRAMMREAMRL